MKITAEPDALVGAELYNLFPRGRSVTLKSAKLCGREELRRRGAPFLRVKVSAEAGTLITGIAPQTLEEDAAFLISARPQLNSAKSSPA